MIDHTGLCVSDIERSRAFYRCALEPLGYALLLEWQQHAGFGVHPKPDFWIAAGKPNDPPLHVAFRAATAPPSTPSMKRRSLPADRTTVRPGCGRTTTRTTTARSCSTRTATTSRRCVMSLAEQADGGGLHRFANPLRFQRIADAIFPWAATATAVLAPIGLVWALVVAPADYQQGEAYRIMFVHVPAAWMALFDLSAGRRRQRGRRWSGGIRWPRSRRRRPRRSAPASPRSPW